MSSHSPVPAARPPELTLSLEQLAQRARALQQSGPRAMLGITGSPGSGKSTLAEALAEQIPGCVVVGMDGFHLAQVELARLARLDRKGAPDTFDAGGYAALLRRLRTNDEPVVYAPAFRRDLEEPIAGAVPVWQGCSLVITEGNYLLLGENGWSGVRAELDAVWHLELEEDERLRRLIERHRRFGKDAALARRWATGSDQRNAVAVQAGRHSADLVVRLVEHP